MEREDLHGAVTNLIYQRSSWETNQAIWYQMRHDGVGRKNPPWPGAANLHFPLADTQITALKPFYWRQMYSNELMASFVPYKQAEVELARIAEQWFNYKLRYCTNLFREAQCFIDYMLQAGQSVCKVLYDHDKDTVSFNAVAPLSFIISPQAKSIQEADIMVHVLKYTKQAYENKRDYNQDEEFIKRIIGSVTANDADKQQLEQLKRIREGFTVAADNDQIIVWEVYVKTPEVKSFNANDDDDGEPEGVEDQPPGWMVYTYSPRDPDTDVKEPYMLPYKHGKAPFVAFEYEIKEQGFYSGRGVPALVAMEETYLTKLMNEKYDVLTLVNRPIYTLTGNPMPNMESFILRPGSIVPSHLEAIVNPPPPIDFDKEMMQVRENAERRIASPDFGIQIGADASDKRTATEVAYVSNLSSSASDIRAAIFRHSLTELYNQAWELFQQYKPEDFNFYFRDEMQQANPEILEKEFLIQPSGSIDSYNRQFQVQKAMTLMQLFNNDPFIKQDELRKNILEQFDPKLISRFYQDSSVAQATQQEEQAEECLLIEQGFPAKVQQSDDHVVHIQTVIHRIQMLQQMQIQPSPMTIRGYYQHVNDHLFMFKAQKGKQAPEADQLESAFKEAVAPWIPKSPYKNDAQTGKAPINTQGAQ